MARWRQAATVTAYLFLGAAFGTPLFGAASTLFWNEAADGNTASRVASRMYDRLYPSTVGLTFIPDEERLPDVSLGTACHRSYLADIQAGDDGTSDLLEVIRFYSAQRLHHELRGEPTHDALLSLPRPVLGALDACLGGSPLIWPLCQTYARQVADDAVAERAKNQAAFINQVRREAETIWCAAAKNVRNGA